MAPPELKIGDKVRVVSYGPFRGLKGTIRRINCIDKSGDDALFLFYQVDLEGAYITEPIWIQNEEITPIFQEM